VSDTVQLGKPLGAFTDGRTLKDGDTLDADVCIIGSGAGGAVTAARLQQAGFKVIVLEEGAHRTAKTDFHMREDEAFPGLYQEAGTRATKDLAFTILQGRAVGGSTVVNWTTSFRTPEHVYAYWKKVHGVGELAWSDVNPHWDEVEKRLNVNQVPYEETNRNNRLLYDGCKKLGMAVETTRRNVKGCMKSGYCGMGCPIDAKQSMLVTYLPDAVAAGATVLSRCHVDKLVASAGNVERAECTILGDDSYTPTGARITVKARRFVLSAGAIGSPAILMRSGLGNERTGKRTWLHPVVPLPARYADPVEAYYGAPQSVASHAHADRGDKVGLFYEAAPLHPALAAIGNAGIGNEHLADMKQLPYIAVHIVLAIDGFSPEEQGGTVLLRPSGPPVLDYKMPDRITEGLREGIKTLVKLNLAMGAQQITYGELPPMRFTSESQLAQLDGFDLRRNSFFSAHVMGGCQMGDDPKTSVVRSRDLRHHTLANLHVVDGSVFPTSLGVNPQESIYGLAHTIAGRMAQSWKA
jgi:choline dehydrogenase-like flavoprotein